MLLPVYCLRVPSILTVIPYFSSTLLFCLLAYAILDSQIFTDIINDFRQFCDDNNITVIEADKNAGICVVNKIDYDIEVMRQLNDLNTYYPSTSISFDLAMINFHDKASIFYKTLPPAYN